MAEIRERMGNLFDCDCQVVVNTVNTAGVMGRGIALEFRYRYPDMFDDYARRCAAGEVQVGSLTLWKRSTPWILNFPTKTDWRLPSKYEYLEAGLQCFATLYTRERIDSIAFPPLGASLGGLELERVTVLMRRWLEPLPHLVVHIVRYDESAGDRWFDTLSACARGWSPADFHTELGLLKAQAALVAEVLKSGELSQMSQVNSRQSRGLARDRWKGCMDSSGRG